MNLREFLRVADKNFAFDFADNKVDVCFFADIDENNEEAKKIKVIKISKDFLVCGFTDYILSHKTKVKKYLFEAYEDKAQAEKIFVAIFDNCKNWDSWEAIYSFLKYDFASYIESFNK